MKLYIRKTELIHARPMTLGEFSLYRGWGIEEDEDPKEKGYLIEEIDNPNVNHPRHAGFITWKNAETFYDYFQPTSGLPIGPAIEAIKIGKSVTREVWKGNVEIRLSTEHDTTPLNDPLSPGEMIIVFEGDNDPLRWTIDCDEALANDWIILE